jgi:DNA-directed RNA polymerase subunit alpha
MEVFDKERNWRSLIRPKSLEVDTDSLRQDYGKFTARPLERGYGLTLGNSLRRVLLSSLQGAAITNVKIEGAVHEFGTLPNVQEDVTEIILNLKLVKFRINNESVTVTINKTGKGPVKAGDLDCPQGVEVLNPDQLICTLGEEGTFQGEFTVNLGRGYASSSDNKDPDLAVDAIPIDSFFSPVRKVNYSVQNSRVGQKTDYDRLNLEVWTDGSVRPEDAIALAAKVLKEQLTVFLNFEEEEEPEFKEEEKKQESFNPNLYRSVDELELSVRSANCLQNANIKYIYELVQKSEPEMLKTKNFGRKSLNEIKELLHTMGLGLGMKLEGFQPPKQGVPGQAENQTESTETSSEVQDSGRML